MTSFTLRDVTLRDGLQLTGKLLATPAKVQLVRDLLALGVDQVEVGAMARPDLVPPMANTVEVLLALEPEEQERCWVWVATPSGARRALEAGARNLTYCLSVSDAHNLANVGRRTRASVDALPEVVADARAVGARTQLTLATAFTCPFEGPVDPQRVLDVVADPACRDVDSVAVCDTLGQATPSEVGGLVAAVASVAPAGTELLFHGHDTWGLGVANAVAALEAGATALDASLAGLGGCPFAPGASGNTATEDLLFALRPSWFGPLTLARMRELDTALLAAVGEPNRSRAVAAAEVTPADSSFAWAVPSARR